MFCCSCGSEYSSFANFCAHYGHQINEAIEQTLTDTVDIEKLIKEYFHGGYSYIPSLFCSGPEQLMTIDDLKINRSIDDNQLITVD